MESIREKLNIHFKVLKNCPKVCGFLLFSFTTFLLFFFYLLSLGLNMFYTLSFLAKMNYIFCIVLIICSYILLTLSQTSHQNESIQSIDKGSYIYQKYVFLVIFVILFLYNLIFVFTMIVVSLFNNEMYFFAIFMKPYLYNMFLPQIICLGLSLVLSLFKDKVINIVLIFIFIFLVTPFAEFSWPVQPNIPVDQIYNFIRRPFEIFYQNGEWGIDIMYGLQCETSRFLILIMWILLLFSIYMIKIDCNFLKKSKKNKFFYSISLMITAICCVVAYLPDSRYRITDAWDGYSYDMLDNKDKYKQPEKKLDYRISQYDLTISNHRFLDVKGSIKVSCDNQQKNIVLTLYRSYQIESISCQDDFTYTREGDYIYISFHNLIKETVLNISYQGYHSRFYSNSQATMLPGYFPWYPMCGEKQIYINQSLVTNYVTEGYNTSNQIEDAEITIYTDKKYITNLKEVGKNTYKGISDSISLFDGYIEEVESKNVMSYLPLNNSLETKETYILNEEKSYIEAINKIQEQFDILLKDFENKKIMHVTTDINRSTNRGRIAIFDDYIITSEFISPGLLFKGLTEKTQKSTPLALSFQCIAVGNDSDETYSSLIEILSINEQEELLKAVQRTCQKVGSKELLSQIYHYAFDETINDDEEFLERVEQYDYNS